MNKFIRTKTGEIISYDENADKIDLPMILNYPNQILKQADIIDELCDGFYIDDGQEEFCLDDVFTNFDKFESVYKYNNRYCAGKYEGYGFIKTPKGLVYVAKMNDEGELELI